MQQQKLDPIKIAGQVGYNMSQQRKEVIVSMDKIANYRKEQSGILQINVWAIEAFKNPEETEWNGFLIASKEVGKIDASCSVSLKNFKLDPKTFPNSGKFQILIALDEQQQYSKFVNQDKSVFKDLIEFKFYAEIQMEGSLGYNLNQTKKEVSVTIEKVTNYRNNGVKSAPLQIKFWAVSKFTDEQKSQWEGFVIAEKNIDQIEAGHSISLQNLQLDVKFLPTSGDYYVVVTVDEYNQGYYAKQDGRAFDDIVNFSSQA